MGMKAGQTSLTMETGTRQKERHGKVLSRLPFDPAGQGHPRAGCHRCVAHPPIVLGSVLHKLRSRWSETILVVCIMPLTEKATSALGLLRSWCPMMIFGVRFTLKKAGGSRSKRLQYCECISQGVRCFFGCQCRFVVRMLNRVAAVMWILKSTCQVTDFGRIG
jgi:hypothetical protein